MSKAKENPWIWMLVTDDEYELPIVTADTAEELAKKMGLKNGKCVIREYHRQNEGIPRKDGHKIIKVYIGDLADEEL